MLRGACLAPPTPARCTASPTAAHTITRLFNSFWFAQFVALCFSLRCSRYRALVQFVLVCTFQFVSLLNSVAWIYLFLVDSLFTHYYYIKYLYLIGFKTLDLIGFKTLLGFIWILIIIGFKLEKKTQKTPSSYLLGHPSVDFFGDVVNWSVC